MEFIGLWKSQTTNCSDGGAQRQNVSTWSSRHGKSSVMVAYARKEKAEQLCQGMISKRAECIQGAEDDVRHTVLAPRTC